MMQRRNLLALLCILTLIGSFLAACSKQTEGTGSSKIAQNHIAASSSPPTSNAKENTPTTHSYTDYKGHQVTIPVKPQRFVFQGETFGDLLTLDLMPVGGGKTFVDGMVFEDKVKKMEDTGFPMNLEKILELQPDLIITGSTDDKEFEALSKIAPTIMFDTFASLDDRMHLLGDLFGKKEQAEQWLAAHHVQEQSMWKLLKEQGMKPGETASVLTYYPGNRLFVMATTGLSQVLYHQDGFKPTKRIQSVLDEKKGFQEISMELLPEVVGDRIFILTPVADEAVKFTAEMMQSEIWKALPAVKNNKVYQIDIRKSASDATTRESLLIELPKLLNH
ncbi:ABC transporter substrate-binding protein [Paenibacillus sp. SYP-B3998]|uniref:ABC transporter substrate-binding protein n=1 Tax=Paenibacillus sp. SYP-B3998 TaxID=2678564 RepID=A0A6G3ZWL2_9BACL|nr:ABC transporter substrate-binding protein [Paenibacillus sp. SYP-B3998]NEW05979.1 ABC transporter substrate-binding protein [Paenibacillus sp. SYP-B3998]